MFPQHDVNISSFVLINKNCKKILAFYVKIVYNRQWLFFSSTGKALDCKGGITVIYVLENLSLVTPMQVQKAGEIVTCQRREYAAQYRFEKDRKQSLFAFLLLRYGVHAEFGVTAPLLIDRSAGKPVLSDQPQIRFNLSHCNNAVACAISHDEVGVDVQEWIVRQLSVAEQVCTPKELALLRQEPEPEKLFAKIWTQKESYGKYTGRGIVYPMREHSFLQQAPEGLRMESFLMDGYALSYCAKETLEIFKVTPDELLYEIT